MTSSIDRFRAAIDAGDLATVKSMVESDHGLLNRVINPGGNFRALTEAAVECQLEVLAYLIGAGGDVNEDHNFPMFRASLHGRCVPALEMLTRHRADVNGIWDDYGPPIIAACEGRSYECMEWLLSHGARISGRTMGATREIAWNALVHSAHFNDKPELLTLLLERGADPNALSEARGEEGLSALHVSAKKGNVAYVRILITHGADCGLRDGAGRTPLDVAQNRAILKLLGGAT
jgi:hypothetical protein